MYKRLFCVLKVTVAHSDKTYSLVKTWRKIKFASTNRKTVHRQALSLGKTANAPFLFVGKTSLKLKEFTNFKDYTRNSTKYTDSYFTLRSFMLIKVLIF